MMFRGEVAMKKAILIIGLSVALAGCSVQEISQPVNANRAEIQSDVNQEAVYAYMKKAQSHLKTAPNFDPEIHHAKVLEMASQSFDLPLAEIGQIYTAFE